MSGTGCMAAGCERGTGVGGAGGEVMDACIPLDDPQYPPHAPVPWKRREVIGLATLYLGDSRDLLQVFTECAAILTDPPFGIAYVSGHATDALWSEGTIRGDRDTSVRDAVLQGMPEVPMLVFGSDKAPRPTGTRMRLIWDKGPALGMGALDLPWKPSTEEIYVLGNGFVGARDEGSVIYHPPVQSMARNGRLHPNEKPVGLLARLLRKMPAGVVGDPFMGSCSTGAAAIANGRRFVGSESDPRYFDIAVRRIQEAQKQGDMFRGAPK